MEKTLWLLWKKRLQRNGFQQQFMLCLLVGVHRKLQQHKFNLCDEKIYVQTCFSRFMLKLRVCLCSWLREAKKTEREKMAEDELRLADATVLVEILWKTVFHKGEKSLWSLAEICWTEIIVCGLLNLSWIPFRASQLIKSLFLVAERWNIGNS